VASTLPSVRDATASIAQGHPRTLAQARPSPAGAGLTLLRLSEKFGRERLSGVEDLDANQRPPAVEIEHKLGRVWLIHRDLPNRLAGFGTVEEIDIRHIRFGVKGHAHVSDIGSLRHVLQGVFRNTGAHERARIGDTEPMFLEALQAWTAERRTGLVASGVEVVLGDVGATPKPSQWLTLRRPGLEAEMGLWMSGECETAIGRVPPDPSDPPELNHYDLASVSELVEILDKLAASVVPPDR